MAKVCSKCLQELSLECFHKSTQSKSGYKSICRKCLADYRQNRRNTIPGLKELEQLRGRKYYAENKGWLQEGVKKRRRADIAKALWVSAKTRAKEKGREFDIIVDDLLPLPTHCPVFGFELTPPAPVYERTSYSLDRIDNTKGYIKGNIIVVSKFANSIKRDATKEELSKIAKFYSEL